MCCQCTPPLHITHGELSFNSHTPLIYIHSRLPQPNHLVTNCPPITMSGPTTAALAHLHPGLCAQDQALGTWVTLLSTAGLRGHCRKHLAQLAAALSLRALAWAGTYLGGAILHLGLPVVAYSQLSLQLCGSPVALDAWVSSKPCKPGVCSFSCAPLRSFTSVGGFQGPVPALTGVERCRGLPALCVRSCVHPSFCVLRASQPFVVLPAPRQFCGVACIMVC